MEHLPKILILVALGAALPAAHRTITQADGLCFASDNATYRLVRDAGVADIRVRIDNVAARPDLRIQTIVEPELADFVLADDAGAGSAAPTQDCGSSGRARTVKIDGKTSDPDVTVQLTAEVINPDFRIYVDSARYSQQDAAALLAAVWAAKRPRRVAEVR